MCVCPKAKAILLIDSYGGTYNVFRECFLKWIELESQYAKVDFLESDWSFQCVQGPEQHNGYDCGVFVLTSMLFILENVPLDFKQSDMVKFRLKWIFFMVSKSIKTSLNLLEKPVVYTIDDDDHDNDGDDNVVFIDRKTCSVDIKVESMES